MPKVPMDYSKTHFYKIVCNDLSITDFYIGHTTNFVKRQNKHKSDCCNQKSKHYNVPLYQFIRDNGNWENWQMILIDTLQCENRLDVLKKEREYIEKLQSNLNKRKTFRTEEDIKQWMIDNKEKLNQMTKEYGEKHKERLKQYRKDRYENKKDIISQKGKIYREKNIDKIRLYNSSKIDCPCGTTHTKQHRLRHTRSIKHQQYLQSLEN